MKKNSSSQLLWNFIRQKGTHTKRNLNFTIYYSLKLLVKGSWRAFAPLIGIFFFLQNFGDAKRSNIVIYHSTLIRQFPSVSIYMNP